MSEHADKVLHLGLNPSEAATSPYARFFKPEMESLPENVREALATGALAHELLPTVEHAGELQAPGYWPVETGYTLGSDGSARVFVLSPMPGVTPAMWNCGLSGTAAADSDTSCGTRRHMSMYVGRTAGTIWTTTLDACRTWLSMWVRCA